MSLPAGGGDYPWPPRDQERAYQKYAEHSAWYGGDVFELSRFYYGTGVIADRLGFFDPSTTAQPQQSLFRRFMFWARQNPGQLARQRMHMPLAADMATTSADLLFADRPKFVIPEAHFTRAPTGAKKAQARLEEIIEETGIQKTLLEAGEVSAALGGVYLRVAWDEEYADDPMLLCVHPDSAVGDFVWGRLAAATFWRVVPSEGRDVYRLLERHEPGYILNGLYRGSNTKLGLPVALGTLRETASLPPVVETQLSQLTAVYVPNMRPNRSDRASSLGRSDFAGAEILLDALDETWTSWMRDLRLAKARLIVPEEFIGSMGKGKGSYFDAEREIWEGLKMDPSGAQAQITPQQFAIRTSEHAATAEALIQRIVAAAGYSSATFGLHGGPREVEQTATEVKARERRSFITREKKTEYWGPELGAILETLLAVDRVVFAGGVPFRPRVDFGAGVQDDPADLAAAVELLSRARAISTEVKVRMVHPDWGPDEVAAEVALLKAEGGAPVGVSAPPLSLGPPSEPGLPVPPTESAPQPA